MVANDERSPEVDSMFALRALRKIRLRFNAFAFIGSLVRTTVDRSDWDSRLTQASHDVIIDRTSLLDTDVSFCNSALIRHDEENKSSKPTQSGKCLRVKTNLSNGAQKPCVFNKGTIAVKENGSLLDSFHYHCAGAIFCGY
jgi:hypothetical protein